MNLKVFLKLFNPWLSFDSNINVTCLLMMFEMQSKSSVRFKSKATSFFPSLTEKHVLRTPLESEKQQAEDLTKRIDQRSLVDNSDKMAMPSCKRTSKMAF